MAEIGNWNGHTFIVSPTLVRGFTGLSIKGSAETKEKTEASQQYVSLKESKPIETTMTVELHATLGCDVRTEALLFVDEAIKGASGYFYVGGQKLVLCQLMLTEAGVEDIEIAPGGTWVSAKIKLNLKQATVLDGTKIVKKSSSKKTTTGFVDWSKLKESPDEIQKAKDAAKKLIAQNAQKAIQKIVSDAKAASQKKPYASAPRPVKHE